MALLSSDNFRHNAIGLKLCFNKACISVLSVIKCINIYLYYRRRALGVEWNWNGMKDYILFVNIISEHKQVVGNLRLLRGDAIAHYINRWSWGNLTLYCLSFRRVNVFKVKAVWFDER